MTKSILVSTFILLCAVILESSILSNISIIYIVPDLVLICSIYFSLLNGKVVGETTGFISGLLLDFITGIPFGFNILFRTIIGYVAGIFAKNVIISGFILPMLCVGIGTIAKTLMVEVLGLLFPNVHIYIAGLISYDFLFEFIENVLLAPFVFKFLSFFRKSIAVRSVKDSIDND